MPTAKNAPKARLSPLLSLFVLWNGTLVATRTGAHSRILSSLQMRIILTRRTLYFYNQ